MSLPVKTLFTISLSLSHERTSERRTEERLSSQRRGGSASEGKATVMAMALKQTLTTKTPRIPFLSISTFYRLFSSKSNPSYTVKVGIPEFLTGVGKGVETHIPKLEAEIGDMQKLLVTRTLKLKKLGIPCKHRKLILKYTHKYRLGLWRPRDDLPKRQSA
ncbi:hypothetical protein AAC387_Pa09g0206 [Persea americana]